MQRRLALVASAVVSVSVLLSGCGETLGGNTAGNGSSTGGSGGSGAVTAANEYLYASAAQAGGNIYGFRIDTSTGKLTALAGSPFAENAGPPAGCPTCYLGLLADPAGRFLFYTFGVGSMKVDVSTGALSEMGDFSSQDPYRVLNLKADPTGRFVYSNQSGCSCTSATQPTPVDSISGWNVNADGSMTPIASLPFSYSNNSLHTSYGDPAVSGALVFATEYVPYGTSLIHGFRLDRSSGALAEISTTPDGQGGALSVLTPGGTFLYSEQTYLNGNTYDLQIVGFRVNSDGTLTPISMQPVQTPDQVVTNLAISPDGKFLYETGLSATRVYSIDPNTGVLTQTASDSSAHLEPLIFDASGKYAYAGPSSTQSSSPTKQIQGYSIDPQTGALSPIPDAGVTLPSYLQSLAIVSPK